MRNLFVRFPTILQACESVIEMLRGQYAHSVGCYSEAAFHFLEASKVWLPCLSLASFHVLEVFQTVRLDFSIYKGPVILRIFYSPISVGLKPKNNFYLFFFFVLAHLKKVILHGMVTSEMSYTDSQLSTMGRQRDI